MQKSACVLTLLTSVASCTAHAADLDCEQLPGVLRSFTVHHYAIKDFDSGVRARATSKYIEAVDPSRSLLLDPEVKRFQEALPELFETMKKGTCTLLQDPAKLALARAKEDLAVATKILGPKYALDETVELIIDPDKRGWMKTSTDREALVEKLIHFQISNYLQTGMDLAKAKKQLLHRYELIVKRLSERLAPSELPGVYAEAFANALDPHSSYMSADVLADFRIQMQLSLEGIGAALVSEDGITTIQSLVPGGQAEKSQKLRPKDKIVAVAQEGEEAVSTIDMDLQDVVKMIRGKKGTKVTLSILRDEPETKSFEVTLVRDKIDVKQQAAKIEYETRKLDDKTYKIGVIDLPSFYGGEEGGRSSYADVKRLLEEAKRQKVDGVVLDMSRNGGGLLEDAVRISGLFLQTGSVVGTKDSRGRFEALRDDDDEVVYSGPLAVLTSPVSASAAEILAGALRDYKRAVIIGGDHTFGKGTVQMLQSLPGDLGALKVTTAMFFLPSGISTQQRGVPSDILVPSILDRYDMGEQSLDFSLPPQSTEAFLSPTANPSSAAKRWRPIDAGAITRLAERSRERVANDPEFKKIKTELEEAAKSRDLVRLSDLRKKKEKDSKKPADDDAEEAEFKKKQAAFTQEGVNILVDLISLPKTSVTAGPTSR
jgi:carboxyl-terminal processing protease